jgi:type III restriction enzyme
MEAERQRIEAMPESKEKTAAGLTLEIRKTIHETLPQVSGRVKCAAEILAEIGNAYNDTVSEFIRNIIEIPRIVIQPSDEVDSGFRDFDLDAGKLNYPPVSEEILIRFLARKENTDQILIGKYGIAADKPENLILNELVSLPEVDYDTQTELLHKLVGQAIAKLKSYLTEDEFVNVVKFHKKEIAAFIYAQMKPHFYCTTKSYEEPIVKPFTEIEGHNLTKIKADSIHHYNDTITPTGAIPQKVFSGFKRACHSMCQFDAKGEKDFAAMLEGDKDVVKWLRPAPKQFKIYWDRRDSRTYEPDFVVETADAIYLTEIKAENQLEQEEVRERQGRLCSTANTPRNIPGKTVASHGDIYSSLTPRCCRT